MKVNLRMSIYSLFLLCAFFIAAHPELLELKFVPHTYTIAPRLVREGIAPNQSWAITRVAFPPEKIPFDKIQNRNRTLRAFFYNDALYIEQHDPREVFLISGNFWTEPDVKNMYFIDSLTLSVRGITAMNGIQIPVELRVHLDVGTIDILPI